jgi:hypothetical protein
VFKIMGGKEGRKGKKKPTYVATEFAVAEKTHGEDGNEAYDVV